LTVDGRRTADDFIMKYNYTIAKL